MGSSRKPGYICQETFPLQIDDGTLCRSASPAPGPLRAHAGLLDLPPTVSDGAILPLLLRDALISQVPFLREMILLSRFARATGMDRPAHILYVRQYVKKVGAGMVTLYQMGSKESSAANAWLAGKMLICYVDGALDGGVREKIRAAVQGSADYKGLSSWIRNQLQREALKRRRLLDGNEVRAVAQDRLDKAKKPNSEGGIDFYFGSEGLQPIIGGVHSMKIQASVAWPLKSPDPKRAELGYSFQVKISDSYDFENKRTGQPAYDRFRKELASILRSGAISAFELKYARALYDPSSAGLKGSRGHVFASYMYAVEKAGYFKPLFWDVTVTMKDSIAYPAEGPGEGFEHAPRTFRR